MLPGVTRPFSLRLVTHVLGPVRFVHDFGTEQGLVDHADFAHREEFRLGENAPGLVPLQQLGDPLTQPDQWEPQTVDDDQCRDGEGGQPGPQMSCRCSLLLITAS